MIYEVIFDIETQKMFSEISTQDPADLEVSLISAYVRQVNDQQQEISGEMKSFWADDLSGFWQILSGAKRIIGFNSLRFDVPALVRVAPPTFAKLPHFDIMKCVRDQLGFNLGLNALASATLGTGKTDVGSNAVVYWKEHSPESLAKLKKYCEADVAITRDLYDYGVQNKKLKYIDKWNTLREFPVDFSYPAQIINASRQMGLF